EIVENIRLLKQIFAEKEKRRLVEMARLKRQQKTEMVLPINGQKNTPSPNQGSGVKQNIPDPMLDNNDVRIPRQVVKGIVDPFELGNSLFMAGNIDEAIKFYQLVPVQEISAFERRWLELMLASCYRVQGKYSEAEASYRVVAGDGGGVNTSMTAKSWLSYISSKKNIDTVSEQFTSKANAVLEQGNLVLKEFEDGSGN
ncbi:MAG: tetratricopeptide repeat protein, partial [Planctomycetota bacterium]